MRIGIDLGGTKIEAIALDDSGAILCRRRVSTPREDYAGTIRAMVDLVRAIEGEHRATATVGVGTPGAISPATGLIKNANSTWLIGRPLGADLEGALGRTVRWPTTRTVSPSPRRWMARRRARRWCSA